MNLDQIVRLCNQWSMMGAFIWLLPGVLGQSGYIFYWHCSVWSDQQKALSELWRGCFNSLWWEGLKNIIQTDWETERKAEIGEIEKENQCGADRQDRPGEKEGYLDEKQKPVRSPMCFFLCVHGCVCVISLYRDSLMAVGIVNSSIASLPSPPPWRSNQLVPPWQKAGHTHKHYQFSLITAGC